MRQQPWKVYLLRCADDTLYCGCTNDVERRLAAHARGRVKYTRGRLPVTLAHVEPAADKSAALRQEAAWKKLPRAEKLRRISKRATKARLRRANKFVIAKACGKLHG
ncbi:MAG: Endo/excinuclease amino terminal domain protein [bacterium]|nr:Endo/excinuclease amino terminal domain protein [bacterium]